MKGKVESNKESDRQLWIRRRLNKICITTLTAMIFSLGGAADSTCNILHWQEIRVCQPVPRYDRRYIQNITWAKYSYSERSELPHPPATKKLPNFHQNLIFTILSVRGHTKFHGWTLSVSWFSCTWESAVSRNSIQMITVCCFPTLKRNYINCPGAAS